MTESQFNGYLFGSVFLCIAYLILICKMALNDNREATPEPHPKLRTAGWIFCVLVGLELLVFFLKLSQLEHPHSGNSWYPWPTPEQASALYAPWGMTIWLSLGLYCLLFRRSGHRWWRNVLKVVLSLLLIVLMGTTGTRWYVFSDGEKAFLVVLTALSYVAFLAFATYTPKRKEVELEPNPTPPAPPAPIPPKKEEPLPTPSKEEKPRPIPPSLTTLQQLTINVAPPIAISSPCSSDERQVDLGLSVLWATMNIGAEQPSDYGSYFAWGEIAPKTEYLEENCRTSGIHIPEIAAGRRDAARANWGEPWRMPTEAEAKEVIEGCTWCRAQLNGINGYRGVSKANGNTIFFPAAGAYYGTMLLDRGEQGSYWTATPNNEEGAINACFLCLDFVHAHICTDLYRRNRGFTVRPVMASGRAIQTPRLEAVHTTVSTCSTQEDTIVQRADTTNSVQKDSTARQKDTHTSSWPIWVSVLAIVLIGFGIGVILGNASEIEEEDTTSETPATASWEPPASWTRHVIKNSFSIAVPSTVEKADPKNKYTKQLLTLRPADVIFQQRGLGDMTPQAMSQYCRVLINHFDIDISQEGAMLKYNETEPIDDEESRRFLREMVDGELGNETLLSGPLYRWIDISGTKALEASYRRTGVKGNTTFCSIFLLSNYDEMVKIVIAYREQEADLWQADFENIIKTFRWEKLKG